MPQEESPGELGMVSLIVLGFVIKLFDSQKHNKCGALRWMDHASIAHDSPLLRVLYVVALSKMCI